MDLFRVFDWDGTSMGRGAGGPFFVPRHLQGAGRHDAPRTYGAWYCSRAAVSAVAESIRFPRGHRLDDRDFRRAGGFIKALVGLSLPDDLEVVDFDDPVQLAARHLRPSQVATMRRATTQTIAASVFEEGAHGILWWSTLDAEWINATLFYERVVTKTSIVSGPIRLSTATPEVREAADRLGIAISKTGD